MLVPRRVAGIRALASAPKAEVTPGRTRNGTPARASASASSPPRPKMLGSPPFSRSTRRPSPASRTRSALISACGVEGCPRRLPTKCSSAPARAARSASGATSAS